MTIDSNAAPQRGRITGTLHARGYVRPLPLRDQNPLSGKTEQEREVAGRHEGGQQEYVKGAR